MKLYEITLEMLEISKELEENEGLLDPTTEERKAYFEKLGNEKFESFFKVYKDQETDLMSVEAEIERLEKITKRIKSKMDYLKYGMEVYLKASQQDTYKKGVVDVILAKGSDFFKDDAKIPKKWFSKVTTEKLDLAGYKKWVKENPIAAKKLGAYYEDKKAIRIRPTKPTVSE